MRIPLYQVDAFTSSPFGGNPAAVCPLDTPIPDSLQQSIALENQLSETAFIIPYGNEPAGAAYGLRWFTPGAEVDLCGHATLAAGHVVLSELAPERESVRFDTLSGPLEVTRDGDRYRLDLPARPGTPEEPSDALVSALGVTPLGVRNTGRDLYVLVGSEAEVRGLSPDLRTLATLEPEGFGVGAPGDEVDIVSRFFCPGLGIDEDPVTGSAHATWVPWFAERRGGDRFVARQLSARGGELHCGLAGDRVWLDGACVTYLRGTIEV